MISFRQKGNFDRTDKWLVKLEKGTPKQILQKYGEAGVAALAAATPVDSGATASAWSYQIVSRNGSDRLIFTNSNINKGVPIAIILQYGHGTGTGGYVKGTDYINPAVKQIFTDLANEAWKEVTKA